MGNGDRAPCPAGRAGEGDRHLAHALAGLGLGRSGAGAENTIPAATTMVTAPTITPNRDRRPGTARINAAKTPTGLTLVAYVGERWEVSALLCEARRSPRGSL